MKKRDKLSCLVKGHALCGYDVSICPEHKVQGPHCFSGAEPLLDTDSESYIVYDPSIGEPVSRN